MEKKNKNKNPRDKKKGTKGKKKVQTNLSRTHYGRTILLDMFKK